MKPNNRHGRALQLKQIKEQALKFLLFEIIKTSSLLLALFASYIPYN
jgi:hypothetical protein